MSDLYDDDIVLWSERQAELLRRRAAGELVNDGDLDWPNIAEEIDSVGRSQRTALSSHIRIIVEHLLKLDASPATRPYAGWRETIVRARADVEELLEDNSSLRPSLPAVCARQLIRARPIVAAALATYGETPRVKLELLHYSEDQVLGPWLPDVTP